MTSEHEADRKLRMRSRRQRTRARRPRIYSALTAAVLAIATLGAMMLTTGPAALASAPRSRHAAATPQASAAGPRTVLPSSQLPRRMPAPPAKRGCYRRKNAVWLRVACDTPAYIRRHLRHPELEDGVASVSVKGSLGPSFKWGSVEPLFLSAGPETDTTYGPDAFSIQNNVIFTGTNKQHDGVQFTDQSLPGQPDQVCVWQVDVTTQTYSPTCTSAPYVFPRGALSSMAPEITGVVERGGNIATEAFLPWSGAPFFFATVTKDTYGLAGRWHNISGSILGFGASSHARFHSAEVMTYVQVSNCLGDTYSTINPCPGTTTLKGHVAHSYSPGPSTDGIGTEETNNLIPVIGLAPAHLPAMYWNNTDLGGIAYLSTTTGKCPSGTPPLCGP
jgi:hypothetical protein